MSDLKSGQRAATIAVLVENEAGVLARVIGLLRVPMLPSEAPPPDMAALPPPEDQPAPAQA